MLPYSLESRIVVMMFVVGLCLCCCPFDTSATCKTDSLPLSNVGRSAAKLDSIPLKVIDPLLDKVHSLPSGLKQRVAALSPVGDVKQLLQEGKEALSLKKVLKSHKVTVVNEGQMERTYWGTGYHFLNTLRVNGSVQVAKIPLTVMFMHQDYLNPSFTYRNAFQVQFDKDAFLDNYRKKLKDKLDIDKIVPKNNMLKTAKETADKAVRKELDNMLQEYRSALDRKSVV